MLNWTKKKANFNKKTPNKKFSKKKRSKTNKKKRALNKNSLKLETNKLKRKKVILKQISFQSRNSIKWDSLLKVLLCSPVDVKSTSRMQISLDSRHSIL